MKKSEAIRILGDTTLCTPLGQAAFVGIAAIKEVQQYQAIGTVEECRKAREKQRARKPIGRKELKDFSGQIYSLCGKCPRCGAEELLFVHTAYCPKCGQAILWNFD